MRFSARLRRGGVGKTTGSGDLGKHSAGAAVSRDRPEGRRRMGSTPGVKGCGGKGEWKRPERGSPRTSEARANGARTRRARATRCLRAMTPRVARTTCLLTLVTPRRRYRTRRLRSARSESQPLPMHSDDDQTAREPSRGSPRRMRSASVPPSAPPTAANSSTSGGRYQPSTPSRLSCWSRMATTP